MSWVRVPSAAPHNPLFHKHLGRCACSPSLPAPGQVPIWCHKFGQASESSKQPANTQFPRDSIQFREIFNRALLFSASRTGIGEPESSKWIAVRQHSSMVTTPSGPGEPPAELWDPTGPARGPYRIFGSNSKDVQWLDQRCVSHRSFECAMTLNSRRFLIEHRPVFQVSSFGLCDASELQPTEHSLRFNYLKAKPHHRLRPPWSSLGIMPRRGDGATVPRSTALSAAVLIMMR